MHKFKLNIKLATLVLLASCSFARASLDDELQALYAKYGRDSVARKVAGDNPSTTLPDTQGALVPLDTDKNGRVKGLQLFPHQPFRLLIRRTYTEVMAGEDYTITDSKDSFRKIEAAQFAYSHDYLKHGDRWSAIASVITPFDIVDAADEPAAQHGLELQHLQFVPSISLNRVTSDFDESNHVDELTFRTGLFAQWLGAERSIRLLSLIANATYVRDTGFHRGGIIAGEVDLQPITDLPGNRTFYRLIGTPNDTKREHAILEFLWRARLHSEFGTHTASATDDDFFRVGPVLTLKLDPFFIQRLTASVEYGYLLGVTGTPENSHHLLAKVGLILDRPSPEGKIETDHLTVNATYEDGDTPLVQNRVKTFLISVGVKY